MKIVRTNWAWLATLGGAALLAMAPGAAPAQSTINDTNSVAPPFNPAANSSPDGLKSVLVPTGDAAATTPANTAPDMVPVQPRRFDPSVRPASATEPAATFVGQAPSAGSTVVAAAAVTSDSTLAAAQAAADLLATAQSGPREHPLEGRSLSLLEALSTATGDRPRQLLIARGYWKLWEAQAQFNWLSDTAARFDELAAGRTAVESGVLATARAAALAESQQARVDVVVAQQALADLLPAPTGPAGPGPLTTDLPLVGAYRTYFDILFAQRAAPPRLRLIDRTLPLRRDVIDTRTLAVQAALSAAHQASDARAKATGDLAALLSCQAELARQRHDFLTAVSQYNLEVAEYALAVADPALPNDRLVGMLIPIKAASPTPAINNEPTIAKPRDDDKLMQPALPAKSPAPAERPRDGAPGGTTPTPFGTSAAPAAGTTTPYGTATVPAGNSPTSPGAAGVPPLLNPAAPSAGSGSPSDTAPKSPFSINNGR